MSDNPKVNANEVPLAKSEELESGELEKISGGAPVVSSPPKQPPKPGVFEIEDFSFDT